MMLTIVAGCAVSQPEAPAPAPTTGERTEVISRAEPPETEEPPTAASIHPCAPGRGVTDEEVTLVLDSLLERSFEELDRGIGALQPISFSAQELRQCEVLRAGMLSGETAQLRADARYAYGRVMFGAYYVDAAIGALEPLVLEGDGDRTSRTAELLVDALVVRARYGADPESATKALLAWFERFPTLEFYEREEAKSLRVMKAELEPQFLMKLGAKQLDQEDYRGCADTHRRAAEVSDRYRDMTLYNAAICSELAGDDVASQALFRRVIAEFPDSDVAADARKHIRTP